MELSDQKIEVKKHKRSYNIWYNGTKRGSEYVVYYPWLFHFTKDAYVILDFDFTKKRLGLSFKLPKDKYSEISKMITHKYRFMSLRDIEHLRYNYNNCKKIVGILYDLACYQFETEEELVGAK